MCVDEGDVGREEGSTGKRDCVLVLVSDPLPPIHRSNEVKQLAYFLEIFTGWEYLGGLEYLVVGNILGMAIHRAVKKDGWVIERFYENQSRRTA